MVVEIPPQEVLDWVKLRKDLDENMVVETMMEKTLRKFKENPCVPIGFAATVAALTYGIYNFVKGRSLMSQYMMRARVVAQGATIIAMLASLRSTVPKDKVEHTK